MHRSPTTTISSTRDLARREPWLRSQALSEARREASASTLDSQRGYRRATAVAALLAAGVMPTAKLAGVGAADANAAPRASAAAATLQKGDSGPAVKRLQRLLGGPVDGEFGPNTERRVRAFQKRHRMRVDGVVGPSTWRVLNRAHARRNIRSRTGAASGAVRRLQRRLHLVADGRFGPATEAAVKRFQRRRGLTADGIVGPATWRALGSRGPTLRRAAPGSGGVRSGRGRLGRIIRAANAIARTPYKWGGGHGQWNDSGYDCSGTVSYVLHAAGLLDSSMTADRFMNWGLPGRGRHVTIYANGGHVFMVIDGRRYDSSALRLAGSRWTSQMRDTSSHVARHPRGL